MTLYRKYRPQKFSEVEGQEHIIQTLTGELVQDKLTHAYLFAGPRGTGKTTIARLLAKAVNCHNQTKEMRRQGKVEPCNRCLSCKEIIAGKSLDLIEIDAASHRGIDEIRALRENVRFSPYHKSSYKIFIIDEVHMLTREAFNALLKTLEEPPPRTLFILATTEVHQVIPTILSRCQRFDFKRLTREQIERRLKKILKKEKRNIDAEILKLIAAKADGAIRDAESFLGQILTWPRQEVRLEKIADFLGAVDWSLIFNFLSLLFEKKKGEAIKLVNEVVRRGYDLENFSERVIDCLRRIMLTKINPDLADHQDRDFSESEKGELFGFSQKMSLKDLVYLSKLLLIAKNNLKTYPISQFSLELAIVDYCPEEEKAEKKEIENQEGITKVTNLDQSFDLEKVLQKWSEVIAKVAPLNYSLCAFLKLCQPVAFKNGSLVLGFPRDFHKNIVSQDTNRKIVEKALDNVLGGKWRVQCEKVDFAPANNHLTRDVLDVFGGEMVKWKDTFVIF